MKTLRRIIKILSFTIFLLVVTSILIAYFYEDKISGLVISRINRHLKTEIHVEKTKFSLLKKFPNASLELKNVCARPVQNFTQQDFEYNTDTLFYAHSIFLQFNIIQLIKKQYTIRSIHFNKGQINILIDKKGLQNYIFWDNTSVSDTGDFNLKLQNIRITDSKIRYHNRQNKVIITANSNRTDISGDISSTVATLKINTDAYLQQLRVNNNSILANKPCKVKTQLIVADKKYTLEGGNITLSNGSFDVSGNIELLDDDTYLDIKVLGSKMSVRSFLSLIPPKYVKDLQDYSSNGDFYFNASLKGKVSSGHFPNFDAVFGIKNGEISKINTPWIFTDVNLEGNYSSSFNREKNLFTLNNFTAKLGNSSLTGTLTVENFKAPSFVLYITSTIDLADLKTFFKADTFEILTGTAITDLTIQGTITNPQQKIEKKDLLNWNVQGTSGIDNLQFRLKSSEEAFENISCKLILDKTVMIENLQFSYARNSFDGHCIVHNLPGYILKDGILSISDMYLHSPHLVIDSLSNTNHDVDKENWPIPFPDKIKYQGSIFIESFSYSKFQAKDIEATLTYKPKILAVQSFDMNTMEGSIMGGGAVVLNRRGELNAITNVDLIHIDITQLFSTFNNFNQKVLTSENLKGTLSGNISFAADWDENQKIILSSIQSECKVIIENGELLEFEPMLNLSRYCEVTELMDIKFSNLENEIIIKDEKVIIPQMDIHTNAFNISGSGVHQFNNQYEYKVKVLLSEVLFNKAKKARKENQEFAVFEEEDKDRASLYFTITGDGENYKVSYDKKTALESIKQDLMEEKNQLKNLLKKEFGWFKKDTTLKPGEDKEIKKPVFDIEWENSEQESSKDTVHQNQSETFRIEWEDE